jgi:hypothetical protein
MFVRPRIAILTGLATIATVGCLGLGRLVPSSTEGIDAEKRAEEVARAHLETVHGKPVDAAVVGVFRREDGYFVLVNFHHHSAGRPDDLEFATVAISTDWEVVAVDYTDEGRRLKDPKAITTEARENALPAETTARLIRRATEQGLLPPSQTGQPGPGEHGTQDGEGPDQRRS